MSNPYPNSILHALTALTILTTPATATDWHVSPIGDDTAAGTSETPFATIQHAIDVAAVEDDTVWLHRGAYTGDGNRDIETRGKSIRISSVTGAAADCLIDCQGKADEPHIGFHIREGGELILEGVTIAHAWTDAARQGAVYVEDRAYLPPQDGFAAPDGSGGFVTLTNVVIRRTHGTGVTLLGLWAWVQMSSCKITGSSDHGIYYGTVWGLRAFNTTIQRSGGHGAMCRNGFYSDGMDFQDCTIIDNAGSGVWSDGGTGGDDNHTEINNCSILRNGGPGITIDGPLGVRHTTIADNGGGGVIGMGWMNTDWWVQWSRILDNGDDGIRMAADWLQGYTIYRNEIRGNHGDGIDLTVRDQAHTARECLIADNKGHGVVYRLVGSDCSGGLDGSTVVGNRGAGVFVAENVGGQPVVFERSIIAFNGGAALQEALVVAGVSCTDVFGNLEDWTGALAGFAGTEGNLAVDPGFCDGGGYGLMGSSPCAGENNAECGQIGARGVECAGVTDVAGAAAPGAAARIVGAFPNPFNPRTTLVYEIPQATRVDLQIYDVRGRLVRALVAGDSKGPGRHEVVWRGRDELGRQVATGVYFYRLEAGGYRETSRMMLVK